MRLRATEEAGLPERGRGPERATRKTRLRAIGGAEHPERTIGRPESAKENTPACCGRGGASWEGARAGEEDAPAYYGQGRGCAVQPLGGLPEKVADLPCSVFSYFLSAPCKVSEYSSGTPSLTVPLIRTSDPSLLSFC